MTLVDLADLKAALAMLRDAERKRDAALAENARLRAAVERARDSCLHHATGQCFSIDDSHVCVEAEQDAFYDAAMWLTGALAAPTADDGAERGAR